MAMAARIQPRTALGKQASLSWTNGFIHLRQPSVHRRSETAALWEERHNHHLDVHTKALVVPEAPKDSHREAPLAEVSSDKAAFFSSALMLTSHRQRSPMLFSVRWSRKKDDGPVYCGSRTITSFASPGPSKTLEESPSLSSIAYEQVGKRVHSPLPIFFETVDELNNCFRSAQDLAFEKGATRILVRAVVHSSLAQAFQSTGTTTKCCIFTIEATVPIQIQHQQESALVMLYFGWNHPSRQPSRELMALQDDLRQKIFDKQPRRSQDDILTRLHQRACRVEYLDETIDHKDFDRILKIHQDSFHTLQDWNVHKFESVLANPNKYTVAVARSEQDGQINCISILEYSAIPLQDSCRALRLAEYVYTGRAYVPGQPHCGLASALKLWLASAAAARNVDVCFCESRAASGGITGTNHRLGMKFAGRLPQHILISGPRDIAAEAESPFEDLGVWYLPRPFLQHAAETIRRLKL